jgi:hypothetical protein
MKPSGQFHTPSALSARLERPVPGEEEKEWDIASLDVFENYISVNQTANPRSFRSTLVSKTHTIFLIVIITAAAPTVDLLVLVSVLITLILIILLIMRIKN